MVNKVRFIAFGEEYVSRQNVKHEARLTEGARSMQDTCLNCGESFGLGAGQPLLSMRLFCVVWYTYIQGVAV
jgi:hypothetical protein